MKKLIHIISRDHGGGAAVNSARLAESLNDLDQHFVVLTGSKSTFVNSGGASYSVEYLKIKSILGMFRKYDFFSRIDSDTIVLTNGFGPLLFLLITPFICRHPNWIHNTRGANLHGKFGIIKFITYIIAFTMKDGPLFVFVSESERRAFLKKLFFAKIGFRNRSVVIPNGVMPPADLSLPVSNEANSKKTILVLSRVTDQKNILQLIDYIGDACATGLLGPEIEVHVYGSLEDEKYVSRCRHKIHSLNLEHRILLKGECRVNARFLRSFRYMLHNPKFEGLATVLTEASFHGLVYVSRETVGTSDFIIDSNRQLFYNDRFEFLKCLEYLEAIIKEDTTVLNSIVVENRNFANARLSMSRTSELYRNLIDGE